MHPCPRCGNLNPPDSASCLRCRTPFGTIAPSSTGQLIDGRYRIEGPIGHGAAGRVANQEAKRGAFTVTATFVDRGARHPQSASQFIEANGTRVFTFRYDRKYADVTADVPVVPPTETLQRDVVKSRTVRKCN